MPGKDAIQAADITVRIADTKAQIRRALIAGHDTNRFRADLVQLEAEAADAIADATAADVKGRTKKRCKSLLPPQ